MYRFALALLVMSTIAAPARAATPLNSPMNPGAVSGVISVELNKMEQKGQNCRAYLVLKNKSGVALRSLKLDLVMFDAEGVVARRLAIEAAPLNVGKTSLRVFDIPKQSCDKISRILLNDIMECRGPIEARTDCLDLVKTSSRTNTPFIK